MDDGHDWDIMDWCVRCGASRQAVVNGKRAMSCEDLTNIVPISHFVRGQRFAKIVDSTIGDFRG